ncbi:MAG: carboxypeptidase-like regulatory domain-containing protein [Prevotella sp.]|nr:carboxypeptidase-like regulatory domain-containing protein [Prevotella sp.]
MIRYKHLITILLLLACCLPISAQQIIGFVFDEETGDSIPFASAVYKGHHVSAISDTGGKFTIARHQGWDLTFSAVGYKAETITVDEKTETPLFVYLTPTKQQLAGVVIKSKRGRYSRKNNPAVELMKKVIEAKKLSDLSNHDYYSYDRYEKLTLAANDLTPQRLEKKPFSSTPWLLEQVETCQYNGKQILPISVDETVSEIVYRKDPQDKKVIIKGERSSGINDLFQTGDMLNVVMKDVFTDVDLYENQIRLLRKPFTSPIGKDAISFYRYYIEDTLAIGNDSCIHLHFMANNLMDIGFRGDLYILKDSSYHVRRCELTLPRQSSVNFVKNLRIEQEFNQLDNGEWVLTRDDMITEIEVAKFIQKAIVIRTTRLSNYSFDELPKRLFKGKRSEVREADAGMRSSQFWGQYRQVELTQSEARMDNFVHNIKNIKGFKYFMVGLNALIENSIETGTPNKIDISPVNTILTYNDIDHWRTRLSVQTTANLNKRWFATAYYARGWGSHRNYYSASLTYSFIDKVYMPWEYPKRTLRLESTYDMSSPSDRYLPTDKDNFLVAFKWTKIDKMMLCNRQKVSFEYETFDGWRTTVAFKAEEFEACGAMSFRKMNEPQINYTAMRPHNEFLRTTELFTEVRWAPDENYINTKQRRITVTRDAPVFTLSHTFGFKGFLGGDYISNFTEAKIYKRFWLNSWGKVDFFLKGGIQWNQVPYPLLIHPVANTSYVIEEEMFNLINNMEFLNDRYGSLMVAWDINGKFFNRIPLIKKLKWREYIGVNVLWGELSSKNNPFLKKNYGNDKLMYFPEGCYIMDPHKPYVELVFGIHNIFKLIHIDYVRRLNYLDLPTADKWGIRYIFRMTF